jgi:hypothetical protein
MIIASTEELVRQANFMSHIRLLLEMVSPHRDDLEMWSVDEIKAGTVARITKLATDAYIEQHNKLQEAEKQKTNVAGAQAQLLLSGAAPLLRPRMAGLYDLEPPPPPPGGVRSALNADQALAMTAGNVSFL